MISKEEMEELRQEMLQEAREDLHYEKAMRNRELDTFTKEVDSRYNIIAALQGLKHYCDEFDRDFEEELDEFRNAI